MKLRELEPDERWLEVYPERPQPITRAGIV